MAVNSFSDFTGGNRPPDVTLDYFTAQLQYFDALLQWRTTQEENLDGFNILRATSLDGPRQQLNPQIIPPAGPGWDYEFTDSTIEPGMTYYYWLQVVGFNGRIVYIGPNLVKFVIQYLPLIMNRR